MNNARGNFAFGSFKFFKPRLLCLTQPFVLTMAEVAPAPRVIPGAPPPVAPSKSQKKKRRTGAKSKTPGSPAEDSVTIPDAPSPAPIDGTPNETDIKEDNAPHELAAASEAPTHDDANPKASPVIELVQKRMRTLNKKIVCCFSSSSP